MIVNLVLLLAVTAHSLWRDIGLEEGYYAIDLRNRVVGARLQEDGQLPYFFHWEDQGRTRYADPYSRGHTGANAITASPFFHQLMRSVCDLPQRDIARAWLIFSWALLTAMTCLAFRMAVNGAGRLAVLNLAAFFTLTEGWKMHIYAGQLYLFIAFLAMLFVYLLTRMGKRSQPAAGFAAAVLILCRPIALIAGLRFLPLLKRYRVFLLVTVLLLGAYALFVYASPFRTAVWGDYRKAVAEHVRYHQSGVMPFMQPGRSDRRIDTLEGIDLLHIHEQLFGSGPLFYSENGNIFSVYEKCLHRPMPLLWLNGLLGALLIVLEIVWVRRVKNRKPAAWEPVLLGWTLYILTEMFSPVHRHQYNTVEWLPVLLTLGGAADWRERSPVTLLIVAGLILNISNVTWLPLRHTLGEVCWLLATLTALLAEPKKTHIEKSHHYGRGPGGSDGGV